MNEDQKLHVGMINSFNVITERATADQIISSGIGIFIHSLEGEINIEAIRFMISYFESIEMFEECAELDRYIKKNYKSDGSPVEEDCECDLPEIKEYKRKMTCAKCNKRLRV